MPQKVTVYILCVVCIQRTWNIYIYYFCCFVCHKSIDDHHHMKHGWFLILFDYQFHVVVWSPEYLSLSQNTDVVITTVNICWMPLKLLIWLVLVHHIYLLMYHKVCRMRYEFAYSIWPEIMQTTIIKKCPAVALLWFICVCFCCVRFSFFNTTPRDWLGRMSAKWPVLCGVGHKTLTQSTTVNCNFPFAVH